MNKYRTPTLSVIFQDKATHFKSMKINEEGENGLIITQIATLFQVPLT